MLRVISDSWTVAQTNDKLDFIKESGFEAFALNVMKLDIFQRQSRLSEEQLSQIPLKNLWMTRDELDYLADVDASTPNILRQIEANGKQTYLVNSLSGLGRFQMLEPPPVTGTTVVPYTGGGLPYRASPYDVSVAAIMTKQIGDAHALPGSSKYITRQLSPGSELWKHTANVPKQKPTESTAGEPKQGETQPTADPQTQPQEPSSSVPIPTVATALTCAAKHDMDFIDYHRLSSTTGLSSAFDKHTVSTVSEVVKHRKRSNDVINKLVETSTNRIKEQEERLNELLERLDKRTQELMEQAEEEERMKKKQQEEEEEEEEEARRKKKETPEFKEPEADGIDWQDVKERMSREIESALTHASEVIGEATAKFRADMSNAINVAATMFNRVDRAIRDRGYKIGQWIGQSPEKMTDFLIEQSQREVFAGFASESADYNFHRNLPPGLDEGVAVWSAFLFARNTDSATDTAASLLMSGGGSTELDWSMGAVKDAWSSTFGSAASTASSVQSTVMGGLADISESASFIPDPDESRRSSAKAVDKTVREVGAYVSSIPDPDETRRASAKAIDALVRDAAAVYQAARADALSRARAGFALATRGRAVDRRSGIMPLFTWSEGGSDLVDPQDNIPEPPKTGLPHNQRDLHSLLVDNAKALVIYVNQPADLQPQQKPSSGHLFQDQGKVDLVDDDEPEPNINQRPPRVDNSKALVLYEGQSTGTLVKPPIPEDPKPTKPPSDDPDPEPEPEPEPEDDDPKPRHAGRKRQGRWIISGGKRYKDEKTDVEKKRLLSLRPFLASAGTSIFDEQDDPASTELKMRNLEMGMTPHNPLGVLDNRLALSQLAQDGVRYTDLDPVTTNQYFTGGSLCDGDRLYGTKRNVFSS